MEKKQHREVEDKYHSHIFIEKGNPPDHIELQFLNCMVQHGTAGPKDDFQHLMKYSIWNKNLNREEQVKTSMPKLNWLGTVRQKT